MTDIIETRLNDVPYSATSCSWLLAGAPFVGLTQLSYSEKRESKLVYGSRRDGTPLGITSGKYSLDAFSFTLLRSSFERLTDILTALGLGSYGDARWPFIGTYSEPLAPVPPITVAISGAKIVGVSDEYQEGIDELLTKVDCMGLALVRNGKRLWSVVNGLVV